MVVVFFVSAIVSFTFFFVVVFFAVTFALFETAVFAFAEEVFVVLDSDFAFSSFFFTPADAAVVVFFLSAFSTFCVCFVFFTVGDCAVIDFSGTVGVLDVTVSVLPISKLPGMVGAVANFLIVATGLFSDFFFADISVSFLFYARFENTIKKVYRKKQGLSTESQQKMV
ncbi:MAG: hypothetical protein IJP92_01510 [Lachnospiraceae bacterium]|nr:hypothetical protein [Lachnospiraceae bacterium]